MAASFFGNALQVEFDFVLGMENAGMVEIAVAEFFANAKVLAGTIVSSFVTMKFVISKEMFAEAFGLPTEGMVGFLGIQKETVKEMRVKFLGTDAPFRSPSTKMEFLLLHDIVEKKLCAKSGSFDMVTSEKFDMMVAITAGLKNVLKEDLGELVKLHPQKVLTSKSVQTYIKKNLDVKPTGETSKQTEDTASNNEGDTRKKKLVKKTVPSPTMEAGSTDAPTNFSSQHLDWDLRPRGGQKKQGGTKRKQVIDSSGSESTISLPLTNLAKEKRTQKTKTQLRSTDDMVGSQPCPIPEVLAGCVGASGDELVDVGPGGHERSDYQGCETQMDHVGPDVNVSNDAQGEQETFTGGCPKGETFEIED
ncbi:hypothetical protein F511_41659 [Dorcoceras hygrometricum]|uniref:Uncharacterized protein n=1 Tax=Dorcoceras hygrometricum TaxID=472368 RepID=A0A2Z7C339_9LAMI|nr:hypothetical protein F511_41659 [Dorcoceras hygrometricum]